MESNEKDESFKASSNLNKTGKKPTSARARKLNRDLITTLIHGLFENLEVNIQSLVPATYRTKMKGRKFKPPPRPRSEAAELNRKTMDGLLATLELDPYCNVLSQIDSTYSAKLDEKTVTEPILFGESSSNSEPEAFHDYFTSRHFSSMVIVYPLSSTIVALIESAKSPNSIEDDITALKRIVRNSECIFKDVKGSFVTKVADNIIIKCTSRGQLNHCLALKYLADYGPAIPAPQVHGLVMLKIKLGLMFTSYACPSIIFNKFGPG